MTKSEAKAKMVEWIEQKYRETDILAQLMNEQYILGMLDFAQVLGIIKQDERIELLGLFTGDHEEGEAQEEPEDSQEIRPEEPEESEDDDGEVLEEEVNPYNYIVYAYKDYRLHATRFCATLDEAMQFREQCRRDGCDDISIYGDMTQTYRRID